MVMRRAAACQGSERHRPGHRLLTPNQGKTVAGGGPAAEKNARSAAERGGDLRGEVLLLALDALAKLDAREAGDRDRRAGVLGRRLEHLGDLGLAVDDVDLLQQHRSEEHTSELQSLMRISYAVFCLKK